MADFIDDGYTLTGKIGDSIEVTYRPRTRQQWKRWITYVVPSSPKFDMEAADQVAVEIFADRIVEWSADREPTAANVAKLSEPALKQLSDLVMVDPSTVEEAAKNFG